MRLSEVCSALNLAAETVVLRAIDTGLPVSDQLLDCDMNAAFDDELLRETARQLLGRSEGDKFMAEAGDQAAGDQARWQEQQAVGEEQERASNQPTEASRTNIHEIARIRGVDLAAAAEFWQQVNATAPRQLSTNDVLVLLRAQREKASTIAPGALASAVRPFGTAPQTAADPAVPCPNSTAQALHEAAPMRPTTASTRQPAGPDPRATLAHRYDLDPVQSKELYDLLALTARECFGTSKELSKFIMDNDLGCRFPNISGIVRMEQDGKEWPFDGGFHPRVYAIVCDELGLSSQGTRARAVGFTSFRDRHSESGR